MPKKSGAKSTIANKKSTGKTVSSLVNRKLNMTNLALKKANEVLEKSNKKILTRSRREKKSLRSDIQSGKKSNKLLQKTVDKGDKETEAAKAGGAALQKATDMLVKSYENTALKGNQEKAALRKDIKVEKRSNENLRKKVSRKTRESKAANAIGGRLQKANSLLARSNRRIVSKGKREKAEFTIKIESGNSRSKKLKLIVERGNKEAKKAKAIIKKKDYEIEQLNKELTSFSHIASHDLQEPLRKIQLIAELILEKEKKNLSSLGKSYFVRMHKSAKRIQDLIRDLIEYANTNKKFFKLENTDLNGVLREVKNALRKELRQSKARVSASKLPALYVAPFQFIKLFTELINNSIKFAKLKVRPVIVVKSEMVKGNKLKSLGLSVRKTYCHLTFADNGSGFEPKYSERIFEVFQKLKVDDEKGSGIGLATCRKIVENYQGKIFAVGELGKGAVIHIYMPVHPGTRLSARM